MIGGWEAELVLVTRDVLSMVASLELRVKGEWLAGSEPSVYNCEATH